MKKKTLIIGGAVVFVAAIYFGVPFLKKRQLSGVMKADASSKVSGDMISNEAGAAMQEIRNYNTPAKYWANVLKLGNNKIVD